MESAEATVGTRLPEMARQVTQESINRYAAASGDFNPLHIDPDFARKTPLGGTVAHGMLVLAYLSEFMEASFGSAWRGTGTLSARFKAPAYPGDTLTVSGNVTGVEKEEGFAVVSCDLLCRNQKGDPVIVCDATVRMRE